MTETSSLDHIAEMVHVTFSEQTFTDEFLTAADLNVRTIPDLIAGAVRVNVDAWIAGGAPVDKTAELTVTLYFPKTWLDHLRRDVLCRWTRNPLTGLGRRLDRWANRFRIEPYVRTATETVTVPTRLCPHVRSKTGRHLRFLVGDDG